MIDHYQTTTWADSRLVAKPSAISGMGIVADADIHEGELLMVFGGEIVHRNELTEEQYRLQTAFPIDKNRFIVLPTTNTSDTVDEYLNHSCNPTAWLTDEVTVVARRNIKKGEEITLDAATWDIDEVWLYSEDGTCYCSDPDCRKTLSPFDYLNPVLQEKYKGHFSPYIEVLLHSSAKKHTVE